MAKTRTILIIYFPFSLLETVSVLPCLSALHVVVVVVVVLLDIMFKQGCVTSCLYILLQSYLFIALFCQSVLGCGVRNEGAPHNCLDDACAAMKLVLAKLKHGFDEPIAIETKNVG